MASCIKNPKANTFCIVLFLNGNEWIYNSKNKKCTHCWWGRLRIPCSIFRGGGRARRNWAQGTRVWCSCIDCGPRCASFSAPVNKAVAASLILAMERIVCLCGVCERANCKGKHWERRASRSCRANSGHTYTHAIKAPGASATVKCYLLSSWPSSTQRSRRSRFEAVDPGRIPPQKRALYCFP